MSVQEAILEKVRALPPQKRDEVLKFADSLRAEADADEAEERAVEEARQGGCGRTVARVPDTKTCVRISV